jgi:IS30 family transposase
MPGHLTNEQKQLAFRLKARGMSLAEIGRQIGCSAPMVGLMVHSGRFQQGIPDDWSPRPGCLTIQDRESILVGLGASMSLAAIARGLKRPTSTISREVEKGGGRDSYGAWRAHRRARDHARRPKAFKLQRGRLLQEVSARLTSLWSPQEVSERLRLDHPDDPEMRVSHETIYQSLYVQGRGELRRELARCLRSGRAKRRSHGTVDGRGRIPGMVMLSERPAEATDRAVPGHWEGDLVLGEGGRSAVGTLVERTTRFTLLLHLREGRAAVSVEDAMRRAIQTLPAELRRTITWDQGAEMATHASFTIATGIPIYFCDPHSPWQRGSNENTNGLLRQYLPKKMDLSTVTSADLRRIQRSLNGRPRRTLGYMTPSEKLSEFVALTA